MCMQQHFTRHSINDRTVYLFFWSLFVVVGVVVVRFFLKWKLNNTLNNINLQRKWSKIGGKMHCIQLVSRLQNDNFPRWFFFNNRFHCRDRCFPSLNFILFLINVLVARLIHWMPNAKLLESKFNCGSMCEIMTNIQLIVVPFPTNRMWKRKNTLILIFGVWR